VGPTDDLDALEKRFKDVLKDLWTLPTLIARKYSVKTTLILDIGLTCETSLIYTSTFSTISEHKPSQFFESTLLWYCTTLNTTGLKREIVCTINCSEVLYLTMTLKWYVL
jgi:hypothetical protein